jgi:hypothetical protein
MGLSICYDLSLPMEKTPAEVHALLSRLREHATSLPFAAVSELVRLDAPTLDGPSPIHGLAYNRLEDVVDFLGRMARDRLYRERLGISDDEYTRIDAPPGLPATAIGFAVAPGAGCEPAAFALVRLDDREPSRWHWWCCCKTQYASVHGDDHLVQCHTSVIALLDAAQKLGLECDVRDEAGYYESRDTSQLLERVEEMNRIVAQFAGAFSDAFERAGGQSRQVQGEIFRHPEFERLEMRRDED